MKILVTGANGFIGQHVCEELVRRGHTVSAVVRRPKYAPAETIEIVIGDIGPDTEWGSSLEGQDAIIHLAASVHVLHDTGDFSNEKYFSVNTQGTLQLAKAAEAAKVKTFLFLSTVKVNGERTVDRPFTVDDVPYPQGGYGVSKYKAELGLSKLASTSDMNIVSIRTPLVYGPGVKGNFQRLLKIASKNIPVPLGSVKNIRTMVSVWNLVDLFCYYLDANVRESSLTMVADPEGLSTPQLYRSLASALNKPVRVVPVPMSFLRVAGRLFGRRDEVARLTESLEVIAGSTSPLFTWSAPLTAHEGIRKTVENWKS